MKHVAFIILCMGFLAINKSFASEGAASPTALKGDVVTMETPDGVRFGLWGQTNIFPAPTLFIFASTIETTLEGPVYRQCGNALAERGFICVSLDLPGHGSDKREGEPEGLAAWRARSDKGEDFIAPFAEQVSAVLDHLIEAGYTDPERVAACGTSRGGFMAMQVTAAEPRIRATAGFAPVTALMTLREFHGSADVQRVEAMSLLAMADQLAGRSLWVVIGDRDERVGTDDAIAFARSVTTASLAQSKTADVTLIVRPEPRGHTTPEGAPESAAAWILDKLK